jgi:hypothetical protein
MKKYLLPVGVLLLSAFGIANSAKANYAITLDNNGTSGIPTWAATSGTVTIYTKINGVWAEVCEVNPSFIHEAHWCFVQGVFEWDDVKGVWMTFDSGDGLFLDQWSLWRWDGPLTYTVKKTVGVDNNAGWCMSTDAEDPSQYCPHGWSEGWFWQW